MIYMELPYDEMLNEIYINILLKYSRTNRETINFCLDEF